MQQLARFIAILLSVYGILIWIRILLSWFSVFGRGEGPVASTLGAIVDPYLRLFKKAKWMRYGSLDFSPILALLVLSVAQSLLGAYADYGILTWGMTIYVIIHQAWSYIGIPFGFFLVIVLFARLVYCYDRSPRSLAAIRALDGLVGGIVNFWQGFFFRHRPVSDRTAVWTAFLMTLGLFIFAWWGLYALADLAVARL